jgi:hypothetical protein
LHVVERYRDHLDRSCDNEEVLRRVERKGTSYTKQKEGSMRRARREGRKHKQLLDDLKRSCWNLKEEALYRTLWTNPI